MHILLASLTLMNKTLESKRIYQRKGYSFKFDKKTLNYSKSLIIEKNNMKKIYITESHTSLEDLKLKSKNPQSKL